MTDPTTVTSRTVNTVLGPVPADELGVVSVHEALLSVVPGAEHAYDVTMDRAEIFEVLARKLTDFRDHGGRTIVDSTGMFHGRDVRLYEALSRSTGVHIVASTGMGPEELLGGYFLTPQTNPPTPWPAEKFADLFTKEATEGMVVPRVERRAPAGLVTTTATREGMTATDESLFRGAARTALGTGVPLSVRFGEDARHDLDVVLDEQLPADRVVVGGLDRKDAVAAGAPLAVAGRGAFVALDHVGLDDDDEHLSDRERAALVLELVGAGHAGRILLSSNAVGVAKGQPGYDLPFSHVVSTFVPFAKSLGLTDEDAVRILVDNPRELLTLRR
ncbi:phosphotriesterase [Georgenia sp. EYE_87]|uniref:phosphotriesterase family protein n=1 Tax=Georgenia sp. EYE_87 TaxID=2853448 RepID=UPI0020062A97|nr:phosphotriesterase [Georgenia sp. EYE_87]MCK6210438.1 phosphotriesterase [Georgenia sp. EYE_87]